MAVPKQRRSKSKKRTRKACWKIIAPQLRPCPSCRAMGVSHQACLICGTYKGRQIITLKEKTTEDTKDS